MPPALKARASGANGTRPPAEPLHPVLPNATENPAISGRTSPLRPHKGVPPPPPEPGGKRGRQSFTFEYKLKVIARVGEIGNRAAARKFEIDESMIRYWRRKKSN